MQFGESFQVKLREPRVELTKEVLDEVPLNGTVLEASKGDNRSSDLSKTERFRLRGEDVLRIEGF